MENDPEQKFVVPPQFEDSLKPAAEASASPNPAVAPIPPSNPTPLQVSSSDKPPLWRRLLTFRKIYLLGLIPIALVIVLLIGAYTVYGMGKTSVGKNFQDKVWQNLIDNTGTETQDAKVSITYSDQGTYNFKPSTFTKLINIPDEEAQSLDDKYSFTIKDLTLSGNMDAYANLNDLDKIQAEFHSDGSLKNNSKVYTSEYDQKLLESDAYDKYDYSDSVQDLIDKVFGEQPLDKHKNKWIKENEEYVKSIRNSIKDSLNNKTDSGEEKTKQLLRDHRFFAIDSLSGMSVIEGQPVAHYKLKLDKQQLQAVSDGIVDDTFGSAEDAKSKAKQLDQVFIDKLDTNGYEVWVGVKNHKVYGTSINLNALSVSNILTNLETEITKSGSDLNAKTTQLQSDAQLKSRDAKRLADARQIASALELYFNDNNQYPPSDNGKPVGISPNYIGAFPTSPTPADGKCSDYDNTYWYTRVSPTSYKFYFCLGDVTGGLKAGPIILTENGFGDSEGGSAAPEQTSTAQSSDQLFDQWFDSIVNTLKNTEFSANIKIEYHGSEFGKARQIQAPADSINE